MSPQIESPEDCLPQYVKIARSLESDIHERYSPGDWLPSEKELAMRFDVNRHTLRRAVDDLIASGLVERRPGRGIQVLSSYLDYAIGRGTRFTETVQALGHTSETEILFVRVVSPSAGVAHRLNIMDAGSVIWIESLRKADATPLCVISHYLPFQRFPDLPETYTGGSLHAHLELRLGCALSRTESLITAVMPMGQDSRLLLAPSNRPLLRVKSVNVALCDGLPVEYSISRFRADRIQLKVTP